MDLRQLRYFVVLAEQRHFGRAADILNMAQPPLSQQIKALEDELNVSLFDRSSRPIELTPAGRTMLREARQVLSQFERTQILTRRAGEGLEGDLIIGVTGSAALDFLPPVLQALSERQPAVNLSVREMSSPAQFAALERGDIHIGFVRPPVVDGAFNIRLVHQDRFMVALNAAHPLAQADEIRLADLNGSPFVIFSKDEAPGFRDLMLHICRSAGFMPSKIQEAYQFLTMTCLVAAGFGVALVPESVQRLRLDKIIYKPILDATPLVELYAVWPSEKCGLLVGELLAVVDDVRLVSSLARAAAES